MKCKVIIEIRLASIHSGKIMMKFVIKREIYGPELPILI